MNRQLREKFHLEFDLDAVFIDSWAKQDWNIDDFIQQEVFAREVTKLWALFSTNTKFEFKTIQDVIDELNECKRENECLNGEIQEELSKLQAKNEEQDNAISDLDMAISNLDSFPLGSIFPWINKPTIDSLHQEEVPNGKYI